MDTLLYMQRVAVDPLPGHPQRRIYQPVGRGDPYYAAPLFDAIALAYGNRQAGAAVWPSMQEVLALDGRAGLLSYPVQLAPGSPRVVVQFEGDGIADPHEVFSQLNAVKEQDGCFLGTLAQTGSATVIAPGTSCPAASL